jgi:integrase/recombinase XerD
MNAYGEDFTDDAFRRRLNRLKSKLNIQKLHPHMFRHTFARNYVLNGGDIFTLQRILDHADIQTTRKYVQMDNELIREQHNKFSPLRNIIKRNGIRI